MRTECPNCGMTSKARDGAVGKRARCSSCGHLFTVQPASPESEVPQEDPAASPADSEAPDAQRLLDFYKKSQHRAVEEGVEQTELLTEPLGGDIPASQVPPRFRKYLVPDENILYASNPSFSALVIGAIVRAPVLLFAVVGAAEDDIETTTRLLLVVGPCVVFLVHYLGWKYTYYMITSARTLSSHGVFNIGVKIIPNEHIQLICIDTGIIDKLLDLDTIEISTAAQGGALLGSARGRVKFKHVANGTSIVKFYTQQQS